MAKGANVPIIVGYIDYKKKEVGIKGIIKNTKDMKETMIEINSLYKDVNAKHPNNFILDKRFS